MAASSADFVYDHDDDSYICPGGNRLRRSNRNFSTPRAGIDKDGSIRYRARQQDCQDCALRQRCTPNMPARKVARSIHEGARDLARSIATTDAYLVSRRQRKKVEMLFAHLKRILKLDRLRLRGPNGARDEFHLAAAAQNLSPRPTSSTEYAQFLPFSSAMMNTMSGPAAERPISESDRWRLAPESRRSANQI